MLTDWVRRGRQPDRDAARHAARGLLGLGADAGDLPTPTSRSTPAPARAPASPATTMQFHGTADRYTLAGATRGRDAYSDATTATAEPRRHAAQRRRERRAGRRVHLRPRALGRLHAPGQPGVGGPGARRPTTPIRSDDLFFGAEPATAARLGRPRQGRDPAGRRAAAPAREPDRRRWTLDRTPLPRFWYLPRGEKAAVVMTGDDHGNGGTAGQLRPATRPTSPAGCSVADWECVRATSYVYPSTPLTDAQAAAYQAAGFEIALHLDTGCADCTPRVARRASTDAAARRSPRSARASPRRAPTARTASRGATGRRSRRSSCAHGIRLDTNYYYWPGSWCRTAPACSPAPGFPMRFADTDGSLIDVYQAATQMTDESGHRYPATSTRCSTARSAPRATTASSPPTCTPTRRPRQRRRDRRRGAVARRAGRLGRADADWLDGRNGSSFRGLSSRAGSLRFASHPPPARAASQAMVPERRRRRAAGLTRDGAGRVEPAHVKGIDYASSTPRATTSRPTPAARNASPN